MIGPSLSPLERQRVQAAAKLHASGTKVSWRLVGNRVSYLVESKETHVFSAPNARVFNALKAQADAEFWRAVEGMKAADHKDEYEPHWPFK